MAYSPTLPATSRAASSSMARNASLMVPWSVRHLIFRSFRYHCSSALDLRAWKSLSSTVATVRVTAIPPDLPAHGFVWLDATHEEVGANTGAGAIRLSG